MIKKYKTKPIAKRWGRYYMKKWPHIIDFCVRPHPRDFGFAIFVTVAAKKPKLGTLCIPISF